MKTEFLTESNYEEFKHFITKKWPNGGNLKYEYDYSYDFVTRPLEELKNKILLVFDKDVFAYFYKTTLVGFDVFETCQCLNRNQRPKAIRQLKKDFPNALINNSCFDEPVLNQLKASGYEQVDPSASYFEDWYKKGFKYDYLSDLYSTNPKAFMEQLEKTLFPEINVEDIEYSEMDNKTLKNLLAQNSITRYDGVGPTWQTKETNVRMVAGFHYFILDDVYGDRTPNVKFLVAHVGKTIVGIIRFGVWPRSEDCQSVAFIDTAIPYRGRGIAKAMIKALDEHLDKNLPLTLTDESEMGELCHMAKTFKENIHSTACYTYQERRTW